MKKFFSVILVLAMAFLCLACSKSDLSSAPEQGGVSMGDVKRADNSQLELAQKAIEAGNYEEAYKILYDDNFRSEEENELFAKLVYVPLEVKSSAGEYSASFTYDGNGNLLKKEDGEEITTFAYDENGHLLTEEEFDRGHFSHKYTYNYDDNGNRLTALSEYGGNDWDKYTSTYDAAGNKLSQHYEDSEGAWNTYSYTYDEDGNQLSQHYEDSNGVWNTYSYTYDDKGYKLTAQYEDSAGEAYQTTYTYTFNDQGIRIKEVRESSNGAVDTRIWDDFGRLISVYDEEADGSWNEFSWKYDKNGNQLEYVEQNSKFGIRYQYNYTYDKNGMLLKITGGSPAFPRTKTFTYDDEGNRISGEGSVVNPLGNEVKYTCTYDDHSNIITCVQEDPYIGKQTYSYTYDENGNIVGAMCRNHETEDRSEWTYGYTITYQLFYYPNGVPSPVEGIHLLMGTLQPAQTMLQPIKVIY